MNTLDQSIASQSVASHRSEMNVSSASFISKRFDPFFDFLTQFIQPSFIFYFIYVIVLSIQVAYVSMWIHETTMWIHINDDKISHSMSDFAKIIHYIAPFSPIYKTPDDYLVPFVVFTVVVFILIFTIFFQLLFYKTHRRFSKVLLYPTRICIELLIPLMLVPIAHITGHSFYYITDSRNEKVPQMYVFFVFGMIEFIACAVIFFYSASMIGVSAYITNFPISTFDHKPYVMLVLSTGIFALFETCFLRYPSWVVHPFAVSHIIVGVFIAYRLTFQPFVSKSWNCYFLIIDVFAVLLDLLKLASNFFDFEEIFRDVENGNKIIMIINIICFFVLLVVSIVFSVVYSVVRFKKMMRILTSFPEDLMNVGYNNLSQLDNYRFEIYKTLKIDRSESMALSTLYFVIQNNIAQYLDFSLVKFILNSHKSIKALMQCMKTISYFPPNSRYLNMLFNVMVKRRDIKFVHRFFIYQIQKIKMLRQSSSSLFACEKLSGLLENTKELEKDIIEFWLINPNAQNKNRCKIVNDHGVDVTYLYKLHDRVSKSRSLWNEALFDFPNSIQYRKEFCHFAIECQTNFTDAIKNKHKSDLIESGKNFNVDTSFRLFVRTFPNYLKKEIIDKKGNFILAAKKQISGNSSASSASSNSKNSSTLQSSITSMIEGQFEEEIGKSLITHSRIRLALQHSTQSKKAKTLPSVIFTSVFLFILGLVFAVLIYVFFNNFFKNRSRSMIRIETFNQIMLYTYSSALMTFFQWGNHTGSIYIDEFIKELESQDQLHESPLLHTDTYNGNVVYFNVRARDKLSEFLVDFSKLSGEGVNVYKYGDTLFSESTPLYFCNESHVFNPKNTNLKAAFMFLFFSESEIANINTTQLDHMFENNIDYCNIVTNLMNIYPSFQKTRDLLIEMDQKDSDVDTSTIYRVKLIMSILYAVITILLSTVFYFLYIREIMKFVELLLNLPKDAKMNAMNPIRCSSDLNQDKEKEKEKEKEKGKENAVDETDLTINIHKHANDKKSKYSIPLLYCILIFFCFVGNIILTYFQLENVQTYNQKFYFLSHWVLNGRFRKVILVRLTNWVIHYTLADNELVKISHFINKSVFPTLISRNFFELNDNTNKMLQGHDGIPSSNHQDPQIDYLTYQEICQPNESDPSYHEMYQCGSLRNILIFYTNAVNEMMAGIERYNNTIDYRNDIVSAQLLHLVTNHAIPRLNEIDNLWDAVSDTYSNEFKQIHKTYLICSLIIVLIAFLLMIRLVLILNQAYKSCLLLLRRISPIAIVNDVELVSYLLDKTNEKNEGSSSTDQGIIKNSQDAIICLSSSGIIEIVNPSVNHLFGFTPEQLLGQPISTSLFDEKNGAIINNKIFLMINKQSPLSYEDHVTCITDEEKEVPCQIMIFGMTSNNGLNDAEDDNNDADEDDEKKKKKWEKKGDIESFVVILRDETEMIKHQKTAEEAKKQSESLLYQILPRSIVILLNQGEKDISFSVPSATIMFIDIAKFSEYASTLTPQEIMGNLSAIMGGYDNAIQKYDMLLKIKLIGDVYMCAGGIFNPDDPPASHAEQMVRFGLDALQNIEDMNVKFSALLSVRIGINTGGPLIAGVLGTDKPTFDIIGDPINIASRLQSTDYPGRIQISQNTYELVKDMDVMIEPRGEVYLKGKGSQPAYIISPQSNSNFSLSQMGEDSNNSLLKLGSFINQ